MCQRYMNGAVVNIGVRLVIVGVLSAIMKLQCISGQTHLVAFVED